MNLYGECLNFWYLNPSGTPAVGQVSADWEEKIRACPPQRCLDGVWGGRSVVRGVDWNEWKERSCCRESLYCTFCYGKSLKCMGWGFCELWEETGLDRLLLVGWSKGKFLNLKSYCCSHNLPCSSCLPHKNAGTIESWVKGNCNCNFHPTILVSSGYCFIPDHYLHFLCHNICRWTCNIWH